MCSCRNDKALSRVNNRRESILLPYTASKMSMSSRGQLTCSFLIQYIAVGYSLFYYLLLALWKLQTTHMAFVKVVAAERSFVFLFLCSHFKDCLIHKEYMAIKIFWNNTEYMVIKKV